MSLATRCPQCQTAFKVVRDQLRVSDGWVRCGQCNEVFDATAHLFDWSAEPVAAVSGTASGEEAAPSDPLTSPPDAAPPPTTSNFAPERGQVFEPPFSSSRSSDDTSLMFPASTGVSETASELRSQVQPSQAPSELPDFVKQARAAERRLGPVSRVARLTLSGMAVLGVLGLLAQWTLHERDAVAARWPQTTPWLQRACAQLQCQLGPPRANLDDLSVEATTFNRVRGNAYRLALAIRNRSDVVVAVPSIELTLTDTQDQVIARKVLTPAEWAGQVSSMRAREDLNGAAAFSTSLDRVAGYRVLAFYP